MTARNWMIEKRERPMLSREQMAERCNPRDKRTNRLLSNGRVSEALIEMLEEDDTSVTGVKIAKRICKAYRIRSEEHKLSLIPENYRPGPNYNPDKHKLGGDPTLMFRSFSITPRNWRPHQYD